MRSNVMSQAYLTQSFASISWGHAQEQQVSSTEQCGKPCARPL